MDEIRKAIEFSLNDTLSNLDLKLPKEPKEENKNEYGNSIILHFIESANGNLISRRFSKENKIEVNKFFIKFLLYIIYYKLIL
jgi:hypothetical protein